MSHGLLGPLLTWWQLLLLAAALFAVGELGFLLGKRHHGEDLGEKKSQTTVHVGGLLGLLGLMMAFSFGIAESRYAERKVLIVEEANTIATSYLRAEMLPDPHGDRIQSLLRQYVGVRVGLRTADQLEQAIRASDDLQAQIWIETDAAAAEKPTPIVAQFLQAMNHAFELRESRLTVALHQRLPWPIVAMLYTVAALAIVVLGFNAGLGRTRSMLPTTALVLAITAVVSLIVNLDNPGSHMFRVNQTVMHDLQQMMSREIHHQTVGR